jgi:uncharacterized integral membrane protein
MKRLNEFLWKTNTKRMFDGENNWTIVRKWHSNFKRFSSVVRTHRMSMSWTYTCVYFLFFLFLFLFSFYVLFFIRLYMCISIIKQLGQWDNVKFSRSTRKHTTRNNKEKSNIDRTWSLRMCCVPQSIEITNIDTNIDKGNIHMWTTFFLLLLRFSMIQLTTTTKYSLSFVFDSEWSWPVKYWLHIQWDNMTVAWTG